jgi:hypothetical protein
MGAKTLFFQFSSPHSFEQIQEAAFKSFLPLGGQIIKTDNGLRITQGKEGVTFGFTADFDATLTISQPKEGKYDLVCIVHWKLNTLSIVCLIVGAFVFGILWIIPLLHLFIDPSSVYNQAMFNIPNLLPSTD